MTILSKSNRLSPAGIGMRLLRPRLSLCSFALVIAGCGGGTGSSGPASAAMPTSSLQHILFVGDSFTHGRYAPVRQYNSGGVQTTSGSALVVDENFGQTGSRAELESGPWGGIPGIFAELAVESHLAFDVHIEAISETSLATNFAAASDVIDQPKWNAVVLQELSTKPLPSSLTGSTVSDPAGFCSSVATIEKGVHGVAPSASVYLYEPWARADLAQSLSGTPGTTGFHDRYESNLETLANANHNAYYSAAAHDGAIKAVAPAGEAWQTAWADGIANSDPFASSTLPLLWYGINAVNDPAITAPDFSHPSVDGAYLSGLVLFEQITGTDVRVLGPTEAAAAQLGIPATIAVQLQQIAWQTVNSENPAPIGQTVDPCTESS